MKKLFITSMFALAATLSSFAGPIITVSVEFGHRDASNSCVGRGICRIIISGSRGSSMQINDNTGNLEMVFEKASLDPSIPETQFVNGVFNLPVGYQVPADVCRRLGVSGFYIQAGNYKVTQTKGTYTVIFTPSNGTK